VNPSIISQKFSPVGQLLKKADIWHLFLCTRAEIFKKFQNFSRQFFENENMRDGQIANSTIGEVFI
jgi:hypothetical protein